MPTVNLRQSSFGGGIVSPQALGRSDLQKYAVGLRTCSNAWITRYGTIENRPGTQYCVTVKDVSNTVRLVPFVFSTSVSYVLEFGNNYVRPLKQGARISVVGAAAYAGGTTYAIGDLVTYSGTVYYSKVASNTGHQPDISATQWYAQVGGLLEVPTDLPHAALATFQYAQVNDILTLTSQSVSPRELQRYSDTKWAWAPFVSTTGIAGPTSITVVPFAPFFALAPPTAPVATGGAVLVGADTYAVVSWDNTSYGSPTADFTAGANRQATGGSPITVSWTAAVAGPVGYSIYKQTAGGSAYAVIGFVNYGTNSFVDNGIAPAAPYGLKPTGGGGSGSTFEYAVTSISAATGVESLATTGSASGDPPRAAGPYLITWAQVTGASKYNVYRYTAGIPGFVGVAPDSGGGTTTFTDDGIVADTSIQPPAAISLFATASDYPLACGYYQQRLYFANTVNQPQTVWGSRTGIRTAFTVSTPTQNSDALQFTVAGRQVQPVQALVDIGKLIVHTANAEYVASGDQSGALTPQTIGLIANGSGGAQPLMPLVIGNTDLFVQQGATRLLDLRYEVQSFSYAGKDLTKLATDLFAGRTIVDLAWQKLPHSIVWCVLDNGALVGLTYVREDELWAWHAHTTTVGAFESICVVPEGSRQVLYAVVKRTIVGATARYVEKFTPRDCLDTVLYSDAVLADAALVYDGRNTGSTTLSVTTVSGGFTPTDTVTITASAATFASGDVGNQYVLYVTDATTGLVTSRAIIAITGYTSGTVVTGTPQQTLSSAFIAMPTTSWGKAVKSFSGIDHLASQNLAILADGNVAADPLDASYPLVNAGSGSFTLTTPAVVVVAGLPMQTDIQTLPLENAQGETIANRRISVRRVTPIFHASRGGLFGQDDGHLIAWKQRTLASDGFPVAPFTGPASVPIQGTPQTTGQVWIRNTNPVPFGMSGIVVTAEIADAG